MSAGGTERGELVLGQAHVLGQDDAEAVVQRGLRGVGLGDAAQADQAVGWRLDPVQLNRQIGCILQRLSAWPPASAVERSGSGH
jgi:hypothetical protein